GRGGVATGGTRGTGSGSGGIGAGGGGGSTTLAAITRGGTRSSVAASGIASTSAAAEWIRNETASDAMRRGSGVADADSIRVAMACLLRGLRRRSTHGNGERGCG